mmetsp:Transcript_14923/g.27571  ORF Transcript_14923/g.27571 Transcript_14923/m.27571 type:complete len:270 (-) Transcript_14923:94-903(-)
MDDFFAQDLIYEYPTAITTRIQGLTVNPQRRLKLKFPKFRGGAVMTQTPVGKLFATGGFAGKEKALKTVIVVEQHKDHAIAYRPPMLTRRSGGHGAIYHKGFLYVVGGLCNDNEILSKCERLDLKRNKWQAIPTLPHACFHVTLATAEETLYAISGVSNLAENSHLIQKLSLSSLSWEVLPVKLPSHQLCAVAFKQSESEVFIAVNKSLYLFDCQSDTLTHLKNLGRLVQGRDGTGTYSNGALIFNAGSFWDEVTIGALNEGSSRCILQ